MNTTAGSARLTDLELYERMLRIRRFEERCLELSLPPDPATRILLKRQLAADRARGRTILLSAHIPADHDQLCDRIAILHRGPLGYVGTPEELRARPGVPTLASASLAVSRAPLPPS